MRKSGKSKIEKRTMIIKRMARKYRYSDEVEKRSSGEARGKFYQV